MSSIGFAVVLEDRSMGVEVVAKASRRRYTAEYKFKVLRKADAFRKPGEIGALLRREPNFDTFPSDMILNSPISVNKLDSRRCRS